MVFCAVQPTDTGYTVIISVPGEALPEGKAPKLHWGLYRNNPTWIHPPEVIPPESWKDEVTGAMRSHLHYDSQRDLWALEMKLPRHMAPVTLGFVLWYPDTDEFEGTRTGRHFALPVGLAAGKPAPLGPTLVATGKASNPQEVPCTINFAVALDPLTNRTGDIWHVQLTGLKDVGSLCYGWRPNGAGPSWAEGGCFYPAYIMLDPYCPRALPVTLPQAAYDAAPLLPPEGSVRGPCLLGSLSYLVDTFDWEGVGRPGKTLEETVIMELDVAAFTTGPDAEGTVPPEHRGTYLGVIDRLPDLQKMGATAVLLGNVFLSSKKPLAQDGSSNGSEPEVRRPLSFFAPDVRFVAGGNPGDAADQLKALIKSLHLAGIEVLLEAEFCLTSEAGGGIGGRLQSYAGLDGDMYLRGGGGPEATGVLNTGQPVVRQLLLDALHWWVTEYQVDGFCFVNAENLTQDQHGGVLDSPPAVEELAADPLLAGCKLIAASANDALLPRSGDRGFPHYGVLLEWNNRFGSDLLALLRDNKGGMMSAFATRMTGSQDLFAARWDGGLPGGLAAGRRPAFGVNALEPPLAGSLLHLAGATEDLDRAETVARSLLLAMLVAQGTPVFNAPTLSRKGLLRFVRGVLRIRKKYRGLLSPPMFDSPRAISWHGAAPLSEPDWSGEAAAALVPGANYVAFMVRGDPAQAIYVGFNPNPEPCSAALPSPGLSLQWRRVADTARHPLDQQNTTLIQALPGMELIAKTLMGPVAEQVLLLENIATSIKTGPDQLSTVHNLLLEAAEVLQMDPPELYVRQNPMPNAYTLAITGRKPFIVVHTSLLELLTLPELQAVIAHELGHLKCDHGLWLTIANVLASGTVSILPLISGTVEDALLRWLRAAELTCDRAALLVAQDPAVVIGALMKLAGGTPAFAHELSVDAFLQQARSYDEVTTNTMLGWYLRNAQTRALSHPLPVMRAREIDRWAQ
eukprot:gene5214-5452_t